ncbi:uncharacterized protein LOC135120411 isoform X2 [Zophobas morio]
MLDLVGHGQSEESSFQEDFGLHSLLDTLVEVFHTYMGKYNAFVAHSYGTSLFAYLYPLVKEHLSGAVLLAPLVARHGNASSMRPPLWTRLPCWFLDLCRFFDRWGGVQSYSVRRLLDQSASDCVKAQQLLWNKATSSLTIKLLVREMRLPPLEDFGSLARLPVLLIAGEGDFLAPPSMARDIFQKISGREPLPAIRHQLHILPQCGHLLMLEKKDVVNAHIARFLTRVCGFSAMDRLNIANRGSSLDDKWGLKNFEKWAKTANYGKPVGRGGSLLPLKVLRQDDSTHSPEAFLAEHPRVGLLIDLTSGAPPYDTYCECIPSYVKLRAISKEIPDREYVDSFIRAVKTFLKEHPQKQVAVHCHYGFNRTGFLICCYLIEEENFSVKEAIKEFARARPTGIRHQHFIDELHLRYAAT